jgi:hypothetical protein
VRCAPQTTLGDEPLARRSRGGLEQRAALRVRQPSLDRGRKRPHLVTRPDIHFTFLVGSALSVAALIWQAWRVRQAAELAVV